MWRKCAGCFPSRRACAAASPPPMRRWRAICIERGVTLAQVARAIWLGCARKYTTLLSSQAAAMPIASLSYFAAVIDEVVAQANTSDAYWSYVRRKAAALEQEWLSRFRSRTGSAGG